MQTFDPEVHVLRNAAGMRFYDGFNTGTTLEELQVRARGLRICCFMHTVLKNRGCLPSCPPHRFMLCFESQGESDGAEAGRGRRSCLGSGYMV